MEKTIFEDLVATYFKNIIEDNGLSCVKATPNLVRLEKTESFIEIFWGQYDKEVGIHFGKSERSAKGAVVVDFGLVLNAERPDLARDLGDGVAPDEQSLRVYLSKLSKAFQPYAEKIINRDNEFFEKAGKLRFWNT